MIFETLCRASSRRCASAGPGPRLFRGTSRARGRFTGSSHGTVSSPRPGGNSPLTRVRVCELRWLNFKSSAYSASCACARFHPELVIKFDFHCAGCGEPCCQCLREPGERLFRRRSGIAQYASRWRHLESHDSLQYCRGREHTRHLWRLRKRSYGEFHDLRAGHQRRAISFGKPGSRHTERSKSRASAHSLCQDGFVFNFRRSSW